MSVLRDPLGQYHQYTALTASSEADVADLEASLPPQHCGAQEALSSGREGGSEGLLRPAGTCTPWLIMARLLPVSIALDFRAFKRLQVNLHILLCPGKRRMSHDTPPRTEEACGLALCMSRNVRACMRRLSCAGLQGLRVLSRGSACLLCCARR